MIRKLVVILLTGVICLMGITSALAAKYNEAPMLRTMVAAGELPPVEERLPEDPLVVEPLESIGRYGGTVVFLMSQVDTWQLGTRATLEPLLGRSLKDPNKIVPNIAKDWELSKDAKSFTLYLRKGIKWSDGIPFTADDFLFWYNDFLLNKELCPVVPVIWRPGDEVMKVEKVDDYTVRFKFAVSWPGAANTFSFSEVWSIQGPTDGCYVPAHYLKKFHIKYNPDADKLAKEKGFDYWHQLFLQKARYTRDYEAKDLPVLGPWVLEVEAPGHVTFARNPYYWKVDTKGNQLPYIDKTRIILADQPELRAAKIFAGEPDVFGEYSTVPIKQLPVVKETAEKNNYEIFLISASSGGRTGEVTIFPNHTVEDPCIRSLLNNVKFKRVLSLALNRDEINEVVFLGTAEPIGIAPPSISPFYDERTAKAYDPYDPKKAKELLNEIGLKRDSGGYILCPDGKPLILVLEIAAFIDEHLPAAELIKEYWDEIGVKTVIHQGHGGAMWEIFNANKSQLSLWTLDRIGYDDMMMHAPWWGSCQFWGREWKLWFESDGETGTEPPPEVKQFVNAWYAIPYTVDEDKRIEIAKSAFELQVENLWMIGVVGNGKIIAGYRASLKNTDKSRRFQELKAFQWYFEK